jgi:hypothetical protein
MEWLEPWESIDKEQTAAAFELRLRLEVAPGHALHGIPGVALAVRCDCDDVLFALLDGTHRVAVVHLTWTRNPPDTPPWPGSSLFPHFRAWVEDGMRRDHEDWTA